MLPGYPLILSSATGDGAALANSTAATSIMPASGNATIPAGALQIGSILKILLVGRISNIVTTPGTLTLDLRMGGNIVSSFGAMALNIVAQTNETFIAELYATFRALGSGTNANALCTGKFISRSVIASPLASAGGAGMLILPDSAPAVGGGFDSTLANKLDVFATWSIANAGNSLQLHQALVELKV